MVELSNNLRAAEKHPNSRVAKLIRVVQDEPGHKNIVLLLMEIAEHNEFSIDFDISVQYYINLFEQLGLNNQTILNEAGLLLVNAANIYVRRVDCIYDLVQEQLVSLSNADKELEETNKQNDESVNVEDKCKNTNKSLTKRGRKRVLDTPINRHEIELTPKKIRKLTYEKRFALLDAQQSTNKLQMKFNIYKRFDMQHYLHPTSWLHGPIYDLENDDEIDNKRNYKMFTYHIEHRYHTLVPDINFRLHFKMKDFIDEENERLELDETNNTCHTGGRKWPPLSEAYIEQYIDLENRILGQKSHHNKRVQTAKQSSNQIDSSDILNEEFEDMVANKEQQQEQPQSESAITNVTSEACNALNDENQPNDSTINLDNVNLSETLNEPCLSNQNSKNTSEGYHSLVNSTSSVNDATQNNDGLNTTPQIETENLDDDTEINLNQIRVRLPHLDDEGVYISDLDENDQKMLSPKVLATDVFPLIPHKENIRIIINDEIRSMFGIRDSPTKNIEYPTTAAPVAKATTSTTTASLLKMNIFKLPERLLKKKVLFKLGSDMKVYTDARLSKHSRIPNEATTRQNRQVQYFPLNNTDFTNVQITPLNSPGHCSDFYGFPLASDIDMEVDMNMSKSDDEMDFLGFDDTASRDSGMGVEMNVNASDSQGYEERLNLACQNNLKINSTNSDNVNITTENDKNDNNHHPTELDGSGNLEVEQSNTTANIFDDIDRGNNDEEQEAEQNETFNDFDLNAESNTKTKVQEWHDYLRPILSKSRERHHFDVFELGTEIIETILNHNNKKNHNNDNSNRNNEMSLNTTEMETRIEIDMETGAESSLAMDTNNMESTTASTATFMNIMKNKDDSHVSRYFLSTLLLINQGNLELIVNKKDISNGKIGEKPIEWDEMILKLKSTERHSVAVEDNIGLWDKSVRHKPKETDVAKPRPSIDKRMSYSKNVVLKRAHNKESNIIMQEHEIHNNAPNTDENNSAKASDVCISSTPKQKFSKYTNKNWKQLSRISNIMPLEDKSENGTTTKSTHSQYIMENSGNNNSEEVVEQPCSSRMTINYIKQPSINLKKCIPLPTVTKSLRQCETDSGIFSNDNYQLIP